MIAAITVFAVLFLLTLAFCNAAGHVYRPNYTTEYRLIAVSKQSHTKGGKQPPFMPFTGLKQLVKGCFFTNAV
jgi:hypothetical protein